MDDDKNMLNRALARLAQARRIRERFRATLAQVRGRIAHARTTSVVMNTLPPELVALAKHILEDRAPRWREKTAAASRALFAARYPGLVRAAQRKLNDSKP